MVIMEINKNPFKTRVFKAFAPILFLLVLVIFFGIRNPRFLSVPNLFNLIRQSSILLIISMGATFVILMGGIDLSVGSTVSIAGIVSAYFVPTLGMSALVVGVCVGGIVGLVNGLLHVFGKVPSFLVTLSMIPVLNGASLLICKGSPINIMDLNYVRLASGRLIGNFPNIGFWAISIYALSVFVGFQTRYGRYVYSIGAGETVARFSGVPVKKIKGMTFLISGLFSGLAGALFSARMQAGTPRMGEAFLLDSIAATVMGGTALTGGSGGAQRTLIGVVIISILSNGMNLLDVDPYIQIIIKGVVTIIAVAVTIDRKRIELVK